MGNGKTRARSETGECGSNGAEESVESKLKEVREKEVREGTALGGNGNTKARSGTGVLGVMEHAEERVLKEREGVRRGKGRGRSE